MKRFNNKRLLAVGFLNSACPTVATCDCNALLKIPISKGKSSRCVDDGDECSVFRYQKTRHSFGKTEVVFVVFLFRVG